jgi:hypothetical protein
MTQNSEKLLTDLFNSFDPLYPLEADDARYVDCQKVRGDGNIIRELGIKIKRSKRMTCQLYAGHRGAGKSTELLRLKQYLEEQGYFVVYFAAEEQDIEPQDTEYTDILLACTRHLLKALKNDGNSKPLFDWMKDRWEDLKDLGLTELSCEKFSLELQLAHFAKLTANIKREPNLRKKIREQINPHTITLIDALNKFIRSAKEKLPEGYSQLAVVADNLDRIVPYFRNEDKNNEDKRNNLDEIFLDRSELLKSLDCHVIYTIPISMVYSNRATELLEKYSSQQVLPMIMVRNPDGTNNETGLAKIKELIEKRVKQVNPNLSVEIELFEDGETLDLLCLMSGGHVRNLLLMMQESIAQVDDLPITAEAAKRAITQMRDVYRRTLQGNEWQILVKVSQTKRIVSDQQHRNLLFNRCILEYRYYDEEEGESVPWYDVHPLIKGIQEFKESLAELER